MAFCSMTAIAAIRAYTDPKEYELIIIETGHPSISIKDYNNNLQLDKATHIIHSFEDDQGNSADMNEGAKLATGDYLVFIENDVFVPDNWLPNLRHYLDNDLADVIIPNQIHDSWEKMQSHKTKSFEETMRPGIQDAGLMMIKKDIFEKAGGWDERFKKIYMWGVFEQRLKKITSKYFTTDKVFITHVPGSTYWWSVVNGKESYRIAENNEGKIKKGLDENTSQS